MPNDIFCISDILNMNFKIKRIKEFFNKILDDVKPRRGTEKHI